MRGKIHTQVTTTIKGSYKEDSLKLTNLGCYCYELRCVVVVVFALTRARRLAN